MQKIECAAGRAAAGWSRALFYLIQFTWGLPVNLVGLAVFLCCRGRCPVNADEHPALWAHEYGHTIQCLLLGPLYWPVVALPSLIWCHCFAGWRSRRGLPYDALYCERWATAWGRRWSSPPPGERPDPEA